MSHKRKVVYDKEKSEYYGGGRKPYPKKGEDFKDKKRYNRKPKHRRDYE